MRRLRPATSAVLAFLAIWATHSTASAVFVSSTADAYGVSSTLGATVGGVATGAPIAPAFEAMSANPPGVNSTVGPVVGFATASSPTLVFATGTITDSAITSPPPTATGTSTISALNVLTAGPITFTATSLQSTSTVTGDTPTLVATGTTTFTTPVLTVLGVAIPVSATPAPNTVINLAAAGIANATLILNEQILTGNGVTTRGITTNAFDLTFGVGGPTVVGNQTLTGQLIFGHSSATLNAAGTAVPEPSTFALMGIASATLGLNWVRRRKFARVAA